MEATDILLMNYNLFQKMKVLAEKQEKVIFDEHMDEFNNLTSQRERIKREITANSRQYESEMKNLSHEKGNKKIRTISVEISELIKSIQETDKRIEEFITSRKVALLDDIKNIKKGQSAIRRYANGSNKNSRFLDRKG